jgi:hypothetical protein
MPCDRCSAFVEMQGLHCDGEAIAQLDLCSLPAWHLLETLQGIARKASDMKHSCAPSERQFAADA